MLTRIFVADYNEKRKEVKLIMENNDRVSPAEIQKYLAGVNYPATKEDLLAAARQNGAPQEVIREMEDMDADDFGGPQDVMKAYGGHM